MRNKGITLIEIVIVIAIIAIVIQVAFSIFFLGNKSYDITQNKGFAQKDVRLAADFITRELRTAHSISDTQPSEVSHSLSLESKSDFKYLIKKSYKADRTIEESRYICNLELLQFSPAHSGEMLNIKINDVQKKQNFYISFDIMLENIDLIEIPNNTILLYYTKY